MNAAVADRFAALRAAWTRPLRFVPGRTALDAILLGVVSLAAFLSRWAYRGRDLYSYDSGMLTSGIHSYSFAHGYPHPPFYPLTIAAGKLAATWVGLIESLVWCSIVASVVLVVATYGLTRELAGPWTSFCAAGLVVLSPLALFNGIVALSYALEGAGSAAVAWAAWRCRQTPTAESATTLGVAGSLAIGLRPSSLIFLLPLFVWAVWRRGPALRRALGVGTGVTLLWGLPALWAGGGLRLYLAGNSYQSRNLIFYDTVFQRGWAIVAKNLETIGEYVRRERPFVVLVGLVMVIAWPLVRNQWSGRPIRSLLSVWLLPPLLFYTFVYAGWPAYPDGYMMVVVPGFAVAIALTLRAVAGPRPSWRVRTAREAGSVVAVAVLLVFPASWIQQWPEAVQPQRNSENWVRSWDGIRERFPPNETALYVIFHGHWARLQFSDYLAWEAFPYWNDTHHVLVEVIESRHRRDDRPKYANIFDGPDDPPHPIPSWVKEIVFFESGDEPEVREFFKPHVELRNHTLPGGKRALYFEAAGFRFIEQVMPWFEEDGRVNTTIARNIRIPA